MPKFILMVKDVNNDTDDYGNFRSHDLYTDGNNLQELWQNATYFLVDQDGGEVGEMEADDKKALKYIEEFFEDLTDEELITGKSVER